MIFIGTNVASSKNSKQWTGKRLIKSALSLKYESTTANTWLTNRKEFLELIKDLPKPYFIGFHFVRKDKRKADFQNIVQLPLDLMQKHGWLSNDCMNECFPVPFQIDGNWYSVDKTNPGVWITVLREIKLLQ